MILSGHYNRQFREEEGIFDCPSCATKSRFGLFRSYRYFHLYFIPLVRQGIVAEWVQCDACKTRHPVTVLGREARMIGSAYDAGHRAGQSVAETIGNIVVLSETAADEIVRLRKTSKYGADIVTRIMPDDARPNGVLIKFDYALADGSDWIGQSRSIAIVVDKRDAPQLHGCTIDYRDGAFCQAY